MNSTRLAVWLSIVALAIATLSYRAATRSNPNLNRTRVLFVTGGDSPYWKLTAAGAEEAARQYKVDLDVRLPTQGHEQQSEILAKLSANEVDGVAISPRSPELQNKVLRNVSKQVHLVTFDSDAPDSDRLCYVGSDNYSGGRLAARLSKDALPKGGKIALLIATLKKDNAVHRVRGFQEEMQRMASSSDELEPPNFEVLGPLEDGIDRQRCRQNVQAILREHPDLGAFVGMFSYHGPVLLEVYKELDLEKRPKLIVFDEEEAVLDGLAKGRVYAAIVQDPFKYGYESVRMISALNSGLMAELPIAGSGSIFLPCEAITPDDVDDFRKRLATRLQQ